MWRPQARADGGADYVGRLKLVGYRLHWAPLYRPAGGVKPHAGNLPKTSSHGVSLSPKRLTPLKHRKQEMSDEELKQALLGRLFDWIAAGSTLPIPKDIPETLPFIDNKSAFEYACNYLKCDLTAGAVLPALVRRAEPYSRDNSLQQCMANVANIDGGIALFSTTLNSKIPRLKSGDFVLYKCIHEQS